MSVVLFIIFCWKKVLIIYILSVEYELLCSSNNGSYVVWSTLTNNGIPFFFFFKSLYTYLYTGNIYL